MIASFTFLVLSRNHEHWSYVNFLISYETMNGTSLSGPYSIVKVF